MASGLSSTVAETTLVFVAVCLLWADLLDCCLVTTTLQEGAPLIQSGETSAVT